MVHTIASRIETVTDLCVSVFVTSSELGTENLRLCLKITQIYILLGARDFMHVSGHHHLTPLQMHEQPAASLVADTGGGGGGGGGA